MRDNASTPYPTTPARAATVTVRAAHEPSGRWLCHSMVENSQEVTVTRAPTATVSGLNVIPANHTAPNSHPAATTDVSSATRPRRRE